MSCCHDNQPVVCVAFILLLAIHSSEFGTTALNFIAISLLFAIDVIMIFKFLNKIQKFGENEWWF